MPDAATRAKRARKKRCLWCGRRANGARCKRCRKKHRMRERLRYRSHAKSKRAYRCKGCHKLGHNVRTCEDGPW